MFYFLSTVTSDLFLPKFFVKFWFHPLGRLTFLYPPEFGQLSTAMLGGVTGLLASLLGWQINILAIHRGFQRGRAATFSVGFGAIFADMTFILVAFTGAASLLSYLDLWSFVRWIGVATILVVGASILFRKPKTHQEDLEPKRSQAKNFLLGFLFVIANPAVLLIWVGVVGFLLTHFPGVEVVADRWLFLGGFATGGCVWFVILALIILPRVRKWGEDRLYLISKVSAILLLVAGFFLIFEKF